MLTPPRACSHITPLHAIHPQDDGAGRGTLSCTTRPRTRRTMIPFGRNRDGMPVAWDLAGGRNLLIRRDERRSSPSVTLDLIAMTILTGGVHELVVLDPHRRHRWLGNPRAVPCEMHGWAVTSEQISAVVGELASSRADRPRVVLVADLAAVVADLGGADRNALTDLAVSSRERQTVLIATTADTAPRWYPDGLIGAFDDIVDGTARFGGVPA